MAPVICDLCAGRHPSTTCTLYLELRRHAVDAWLIERHPVPMTVVHSRHDLQNAADGERTASRSD